MKKQKRKHSPIHVTTQFPASYERREPIEALLDSVDVAESEREPRPSGRGPSHDVSVYLMKEGTRLDRVCRNEAADPMSFSMEGVIGWHLPGEPKVPAYKSVFANQLTTEVHIQTQSTSVLIAFRVAKRIFAVAFGNGRFLLDQTEIERDFGVRAVAKLVAIHKLQQVTSSTLSTEAQESKCTSLKAKNIHSFGLDVEMELVRRLVGPCEPDFASKVSGADALRLHSFHGEMGDLVEVCEKLLKLHQEQLPLEYSFLENKGKISKRDSRFRLLNQKLDDCFTSLGAQLHIDAAAWENAKHIHTHFGRQSEQGDIETFVGDISKICDKAQVPVSKVKVEMLNEDGEVVAKGSVTCFLTVEVELDGKTYLMMGGDWYEVSEQFVEQLDARIAELERDWNLRVWTGETEGEYNAAVAKENGWVLLDKKCVHMGKNRGCFEAADFASGEVFFHIKDGSSSAGLNHLFGQLITAAELLHRSPQARKDLETKLGNQINPKFVAGIGRKGTDDPLLGRMLGAKIGLIHCASTIRRLGFDFSVARINIQ